MRIMPAAVLCVILLSGCQTESEKTMSHTEGAVSPVARASFSLAAKTPEVPSVSPSSASETAASPSEVIVEEENGQIIRMPLPLGTFQIMNETPYHTGTLAISKQSDGRYHLEASVVYGFSHHMGDIQSDFVVESRKVRLTDPQYKDVSIHFTENRVIVDYPESSHYGGMNAEPRGEYWIKQASGTGNKFIMKLYHAAHITEPSDMAATELFFMGTSGNKELILLRTYRESKLISEKAVVYDESSKKADLLGEISHFDDKDISKKCQDLGFDGDTVYAALHKDYRDRSLEVKMDRFDNGLGTDGVDAPLTDQEAFYIVTGVKGQTRLSENHRNKDNIGSIFVTEIDHSDEKSVTIHVYEDVRNDENDMHSATINWLTVDRQSGRVTGFMEE